MGEDLAPEQCPGELSIIHCRGTLQEVLVNHSRRDMCHIHLVTNVLIQKRHRQQ